MRCPRCEADNPEGMKFCIECGCPSHAALPTLWFCQSAPGKVLWAMCYVASRGATSDCARRPTHHTPTRLSATHPRTWPRRSSPPQTALEGERKQVTVLFADLKGSMELLADRDPEEARALLDPVLERMMAAVHRYEGTVNQVHGGWDYGPLRCPHRPRRSCGARLLCGPGDADVGEAICSRGVSARQGVPLQIRVGLNSGEVVVRAIGNDLHMDYTAVGQTTHLAARMEQMAAPGSIFITPEVLQLAEGYVRVTALGPMSIRGLPEPMAVYEVVEAGPARTRLQASFVRGLTPFVGRGPEMETLWQALGAGGHRAWADRGDHR